MVWRLNDDDTSRMVIKTRRRRDFPKRLPSLTLLPKRLLWWFNAALSRSVDLSSKRSMKCFVIVLPNRRFALQPSHLQFLLPPSSRSASRAQLQPSYMPLWQFLTSVCMALADPRACKYAPSLVAETKTKCSTGTLGLLEPDITVATSPCWFYMSSTTS